MNKNDKVVLAVENFSYMAQIKDLYYVKPPVYIKTGVKKSQVKDFKRNNPNAHGSNGTYNNSCDSFASVILELHILTLNKNIKIDIYSKLKTIYPDRRFTKKFLEKIQDSLPEAILIKCIGENRFKIENFEKTFLLSDI